MGELIMPTVFNSLKLELKTRQLSVDSQIDGNAVVTNDGMIRYGCATHVDKIGFLRHRQKGLNKG